MTAPRVPRAVWRLLVQALIWVLPLVTLAGLGVVWLAEHGRWLPFAIGLVTTTTLLVGVSRLLLPRGAAVDRPPPGRWPDAGRRAWDDVVVLARETEQTPPALDDAEACRALVDRTLGIVARRFHPDASEPRLEVTVGQCVEIAERVVHDLRTEWIELLPVVGDLPLRTVRDLRGLATRLPLLRRLAGFAARIWRAGRFLTDPVAALPFEIDLAAHGWPVERLADEGRRQLAGDMVRRVGRYAIDALTGCSLRGLDPVADLGDSRPVRVVVVGPRNAGKSSLVNAIVGLDIARVDVAAGPAAPLEVPVARDGLEGIVLADTAGFGGVDDAAASRRLDESLRDADLVLAVTSAARAARDEERRLLAAVRRRFEHSTTRAVPPVVVAVTHVDRLRPAAEWRPPYDLERGDSEKERNIRDALDVIAVDLGVDRRLVVPVCVAEGHSFNVDDGLVAALLAVLPEAARARTCRWLERRLGHAGWSRLGARLGRLVDHLAGG